MRRAGHNPTDIEVQDLVNKIDTESAGLLVFQVYQDTGYRIQNTGYRIQDTGYRIRIPGYQDTMIQDTGYKKQDIGLRIQGTGYMILDI